MTDSVTMHKYLPSVLVTPLKESACFLRGNQCIVVILLSSTDTWAILEAVLSKRSTYEQV